MSDNKITNKKDVIKAIDSTLFLFNKKDFVSRELYRQAGEGGLNPSCFALFLDDSTSYPIIVLSNDADYGDIQHELYHVVEWAMKFDIKNIANMFDFNRSPKEQNELYGYLTKFQYKLTRFANKKEIEYLKDPSEIYSRLNNLKLFLFKYGFIKSPNQELGKDLFELLYTGEVYKNLPDDKVREKFRKSDFMQILIFIKSFNQVNKYAQMNTKIKNYA